MDEHRKPVVEVKRWGDKQRIVEAITYQIMCASYPSITAKHHVNTEAQNEAVEMTAEELFKDLGEQQTKAFKGRSEVDTEVSLDPDDGSKLEFKGIATGDRYAFSANSVAVTGGAVPDWSLVDMLNYSIYTDLSVDIRDEEQNAKSILELIKKTEQKLIDGWGKVKKKLEESKKDDPYSPIALKAREQIHERNQKVRHIFLQILDNSKDTLGWSSLDKFFKRPVQGKQLQNGIARTTMRVLVGSGGTFLNTLQQLANQFQCIYVPSTEPGNPGKLVNMAYLVAAEPEELEIETLVGTSMSAGTPSGILPIGYTFVRSDVSADIRSPNPFLGIAVPKEALDLGGACDQVQLPNWCPSNTSDFFKEEDIKKVEQAEPQSASINEAKTPIKDEEKDKAELGYSIHSVAAAYGLCHYAWVSLAHCRAALTVPCSFKYEIGKRYKVMSEGKELFTGYLMGFTSSISTGSCLTELSFSHIMATGFSLPGTSEMKEAKLVQ